jgi:colicin import membrane protein
VSAAIVERFHLPGSEQLSLAIGVSLGLHLILLAVLALWPGWGPSKRQMFMPVYNVSLVSPRVLMRPQTAPAPKKAVPSPIARPAPPPKPKAKAKEAVGLKKDVKTKRLKPKATAKKADPNKLLNQRLSRLKHKVSEQRRLDRAMNRVESRVTRRAAAGAVAAGGTAKADTASLRFQVYYADVGERVRRNWVLPQALVEDTTGLEAVVVARIGRDGRLSKVWLEKKSKNRRFDASALRAVERAAPFPPLPSVVRGRYHDVGLVFRPEDHNG